MEKYSKSTIPIIESVYDTFTAAEKIIADYFINNINKNEDFSAANISTKLHISEASLTRFSQKCGYSGYREFIYTYKKNIERKPHIQDELIKRVLVDYEEILNKTYSLIDENQIKNIMTLILNAKHVYFYGIGSSGLTALEMKSRFMRLGLICDAFTDADMIKINSSLLTKDSLVIALSSSSDSPVILSALEQAQKNKAKTVLFTANKIEKIEQKCEEVVTVATSKNLSFGNRICPQFPLLVMIDILYACFLNSDFDTRKESFSNTLLALEEKED